MKRVDIVNREALLTAPLRTVLTTSSELKRSPDTRLWDEFNVDCTGAEKQLSEESVVWVEDNGVVLGGEVQRDDDKIKALEIEYDDVDAAADALLEFNLVKLSLAGGGESFWVVHGTDVSKGVIDYYEKRLADMREALMVVRGGRGQIAGEDPQVLKFHNQLQAALLEPNIVSTWELLERAANTTCQHRMMEAFINTDLHKEILGENRSGAVTDSALSRLFRGVEGRSKKIKKLLESNAEMSSKLQEIREITHLGD